MVCVVEAQIKYGLGQYLGLALVYGEKGMKGLDPRKFTVSSNGTVELTDYGLQCAMETYFSKHAPAPDETLDKSKPAMTAEVDGLIERVRKRASSRRHLALCKQADELDETADALSRLQRELQEQQRLVEGLRKDAERYRWLREQQHNDDVDLKFMDYNEDGPANVWYSVWGDALDYAVDQEMEEK